MGNCWGDSSVECRDTPPYPSSASTPPPASTNHKHHTHDVKQGLPQPPRKVSSDAAGGGHHQNGGAYRQNGSRETSPSSTASGCAGNNSNRPILPSLKIFSLADLRIATRNFRPDIMLGEGGFGRVFKGWVDENTYAPSKAGVGIPVAVKKSSPDSPQGLQEWQAEVKFLGKYSHQNLVKLIGYCWEDKQYLLVYEYMQRGSLEDHLFKKGAEPLDWRTRLKIAIGAARGLAFLHTSEKSVIYRDFKASNILLDGEFNAKLSDFGLAKLGPADGDSHVTTRIMGTYGYAAPEYMATGHLYINSDVYGFGVVLLELLTGLQALDLNRPGSQHNLIKWAKPALSDKRKLKKIMDPRLENVYPSKAATQLAGLVLTCLEGDPRKRPSMEAVLVTLEKAALIKPTPKEIRSQSEHPASPGATDEHSSSHYHHHRHYHRHHRQHRFPVNGRDAGPSSTRSL